MLHYITPIVPSWSVQLYYSYKVQRWTILSQAHVSPVLWSSCGHGVFVHIKCGVNPRTFPCILCVGISPHPASRTPHFTLARWPPVLLNTARDQQETARDYSRPKGSTGDAISSLQWQDDGAGGSDEGRNSLGHRWHGLLRRTDLRSVNEGYCQVWYRVALSLAVLRCCMCSPLLYLRLPVTARNNRFDGGIDSVWQIKKPTGFNSVIVILTSLYEYLSQLC